MPVAQLEELRCPACQGALAATDDGSRCPECEAVYPRRGGVPSFLPDNVFWQIMAPEDMKRLLEDIDEQGWDAALEDLPDRQRQYWMSDRRADFRSVLPKRHWDAVLEVGCGAGAIIYELARQADEAYGLDACLESVQFLDRRANHAGLDHLKVVHGAATELPFPDDRFDLLVLNGVLERVGYAGTFPEVFPSQQAALREARRCLRPEGTLYIGIENRFGMNYLLGARDEHTNLRWVNVMPRRLGNLYSHLVQKRDFTAFTHSASGLSHMLGEAGFDQVEFWSPLPSYREIRLMEPLSKDPPNLAASVVRLFPHRAPAWYAKVGALLPRSWWRHLTPHFAVVATRAG